MKKFFYTASVAIVTWGGLRIFDTMQSTKDVEDICFFCVVIVSGILLGMIDFK